mmetsp:Transcript_8299/g.11844  ORF Transcript_8299/g.11844 Transcript_8299/m.11844 type:complete len:105 (+) Transcript_8299:189-503(+)|eukprot:CAMPEP_0184862988 /NCGR_PEP_ID=MMETSP0580-20130426/8189_1 /TAXON_ID=1118495 /ORGANISM="Dactyliosolen fragilissimus" /LENGTH=104 /DNA_ID=CAMNT_0027361017 /DNA_START=116 /DNA_END=430 /DNA_ORIENTATION=-
MSNPITSFITNSMETYSSRESSMVDRVAETSIQSQKFSDERHGPSKPYGHWKKPSTVKDFDNFYIANSCVKGRVEGPIGNFASCRYYLNESKERKEALLKELAE